MRRSVTLVLGAMVLSLAVLSSSAQTLAESDKAPTLAELAGSYKYVGDRAKDEAAIKAKSDAATVDMGRMTLKRALPRLESSTRIPDRLSLTLQGDDVIFKMDDNTVTVPKNGSSATATTPFGESADVSFDSKTSTLLESVARTGGKKTNAFRFNEAGQLVMQVRVTNSKLAAPVVFSLSYAK